MPIFVQKARHVLVSAPKKRDIPKFKAFYKKKKVQKKRDCPAEKCAVGQPIVYAFVWEKLVFLNETYFQPT